MKIGSAFVGMGIPAFFRRVSIGGLKSNPSGSPGKQVCARDAVELSGVDREKNGDFTGRN